MQNEYQKCSIFFVSQRRKESSQSQKTLWEVLFAIYELWPPQKGQEGFEKMFRVVPKVDRFKRSSSLLRKKITVLFGHFYMLAKALTNNARITTYDNFHMFGRNISNEFCPLCGKIARNRTIPLPENLKCAVLMQNQIMRDQIFKA